MKTSERSENISGKYMHYKGNDYDVFCEAFDINGNSYVLYQQCYGDKSFWLRPYDMFFETIQHDGKEVKRFMPKFTQASPTIKKIKYLIRACLKNKSCTK